MAEKCHCETSHDWLVNIPPSHIYGDDSGRVFINAGKSTKTAIEEFIEVRKPSIPMGHLAKNKHAKLPEMVDLVVISGYILENIAIEFWRLGNP